MPPIRLNSTRRYNVLYIACCTALFAMSQSAFAETNDNTHKTTSATVQQEATIDNILPTIEVDAVDGINGYQPATETNVTRNGISAKETAQTIETVNVDQHKNYGQRDIGSYLEGNAGIDTSYLAWSDIIYVRGFSAGSGDIYRDGLRNGGTFRRTTGNIETVEVLKGPASVLYGRGGGGGVINLVSKKASFDDKLSASLRGGSWNRYGANFDVNKALNDQWAVRLNLDYEKGDSFRPRIETKSYVFAPSVLFKSADDKWTWEASYTHDYSWYVPDRGPAKSEYDKMGLDYFDFGFAREGDYVKATNDQVSSKLGYHFTPNWHAEWTVGYSKAYQDFDHFYLGTYNTATNRFSPNYSWSIRDQRTTSNSLLLKGKFNTGKIQHQLMTGYDFSYEKADDLGGASLYRLTPNYNTVWQINPYADLSTWYPNTHRLVSGRENTFDATSHAIFVQDVISLMDNLKLAIGGRYDWYTFKFDNIKQTGGDFSPNVGLVWSVTPQHNAYVSYSKSFAPLGGNSNLSIARGLSAENLSTDPQNNVQYETGIKSDWFDGRLSTTAAIYQIEHNNIRYRPDPDNDPDTWAIAGKERSRGIDLNMTGQLGNHWHIRSSIGFMAAKVIEDISNPRREGRYLSGTSKRQANVFVRYTPNDKWFGEAGVVYNSLRFPNPPAEYNTGVAGYTRFDASFGYRFTPQINAIVAVNNVFDKVYWRSSHMPGDPRSVFVRLNYNWDFK